MFLVPIVVILLLVAYSGYEYFFATDGILVVRAVTSGHYSSPQDLQVQATVNGQTMTTPYNLSLPQGDYTVTYPSLPGYAPPTAVRAGVIGGRTVYATGSYSPVVKVVGVTANGFNTTKVSAVHGVTPVVWLDQGNTEVFLQGDQIGEVSLLPGTNYTMIFKTAGSYSFSIVGTSASGTVEVA